MLTSTELLGHRTKEEYAYTVLRTAIIRCELKPGEKLVADTLSTTLGISPIPIRTALQRLQSEGLVEITPHTGAVVSEASPGNIEQVSLILERLEILSFEVVARRVTAADLARLGQIVTAMDEVLVPGASDRWPDLNTEFHRTVASMTNMKLLIEYTNRALDSWARLRRWNLQKTNLQLPQAQSEHRQMVELLALRDTDSLARVVVQHNKRIREYHWQEIASLSSEEPGGNKASRRSA
jgi:DNA-binding GntR family transcriptional regulator